MNTTKLIYLFIFLFMFIGFTIAVLFIEKPKLRLNFLDKEQLKDFFVEKNTTKPDKKLICPTQDLVYKNRFNKTIKSNSIFFECNGCYCNCVIEENRNNITVRKKADKEIYICNAKKKFRRRIFQIDQVLRTKKLNRMPKEVRRNRLNYVPIEKIPKTRFNRTIITKKKTRKKQTNIINKTFVNESTRIILTNRTIKRGGR